MKNRFIFCLLALFGSATLAKAQEKALSVKMSNTVMEIWADSMNMDPTSPKPVKWAYDQGVVLEGINALWKRTGEGKYFSYIQKSMDFFVGSDGKISRYKLEDYNIDNIKNGRSLLLLYKVTGKEKYYKAAATLYEQLSKQPRTKEGGFWHKKIYPYQMWLDGLYMGEPFYTEFAATFNHPEAFNDIADQFVFMEKHARDPKTGLLYHGWDESRREKWANSATGNSPNFWGRAMGWYAMALVDVLENFPADHPRRTELAAILTRTASAVQRYQDPASGLWYDVLDKPNGKGNYTEASASAMFVYALVKGVRLGYLPPSFLTTAQKGFAGIKKEFVEVLPGDRINLKGTVAVSGLGGNPYRDGSYEYYVGEKVVTNDPKGVGAFLLAANEIETAALPKPGNGKTVLLDSWFNNESKADITGRNVSWHYKWDESANGGFSLLGEVFRNTGFKTATLAGAPTADNLKNASVYVIVDPDIAKENPDPNFIAPAHVKAISDWVRAGGTLVLMANDTGNVELDHFNSLAGVFGIRFNPDSRGHVDGDKFSMGKVIVQPDQNVFKPGRQLYIKEYSSLALSGDARPVLKDTDGRTVIATARAGKGSVFAIGDPWLYNEYVDGRKLPPEYENFPAAVELVKWIAEQAQKRK